jgi:hypothetical protein
MKHLSVIGYAILLAGLLISCSLPTALPTTSTLTPTPETIAATLIPSPQVDPLEEMIDPGDELDGMHFTTDDSIDFNIDIIAHCGEVQDKVAPNTWQDECTASAGDRASATAWVLRPTLLKKRCMLDKIPIKSDFRQSKINLPAFGTLISLK